ncbi:MAG: amino acid permease, partial [Chloroflexi bacterium]|nr:amino acid permease [Chloroflexota bacterium]
GISYARLGKRIPKDSPEFQYVRAGMGVRAGFLAGWLMLWADVVSISAVSLGFAGYVHELVGVPIVLAALGLLVAVAFVAWLGIRESVALVAVMSLIEIGGLLVVIIIGVPHWGEHPLLESAKGVPGIWSAAALIFFAYLGFDELGNLAEEMKHPERDLPRAVLLSVAISTVLYLFVAVSAVSLVGWQVLSSSSAPLADAVEGALGQRGRLALGFIALAATANTVLLLLVSVSRSFYGMAQSGALPGVLGRIGRRHTPWVSILLVWGVSSAFLAIGRIATVAQITNFTTLAAFAMVNLSLVWVLRKELRPARNGGWRQARALAQPIMGAVTCLWLIVLVGWLAILLGLVFVAAGVGMGKWAEGRKRVAA